MPGASSAPGPPNQGHWSATSIGATPPQGRLLVSVDLTAGKASATGGCLRFVPGPALAMVHTWKNTQYAPEAFCVDRRAPGQPKRLGISEKTSELVFREIPSLFPARERRLFVLFAAAVHSLRNKSFTIRMWRGPGRGLLPGRVWGSAPAVFLQLRYVARNCSCTTSVTGGPGAVPPAFLPFCHDHSPALRSFFSSRAST